jgi:hypothetical protein
MDSSMRYNQMMLSGTLLGFTKAKGPQPSRNLLQPFLLMTLHKELIWGNSSKLSDFSMKL